MYYTLKVRKNSKGFTPLVVLIVLALVVVIVYFAYKTYLTQNGNVLGPHLQNPTTSPITVTTPGITQALKLYSDNIYRFDISIPEDWFVIPSNGSRDRKIYVGDTVILSSYDVQDKSLYDNSTYPPVLLKSVKNPMRIEILVDTGKTESLQDLISSMESSPVPMGKPTKIGYISVNGVTGAKITWSAKDDKTGNLYNYFSYLIVGKNGWEYSFNYYPQDATTSDSGIVNQIVSSFKLTD